MSGVDGAASRAILALLEAQGIPQDEDPEVAHEVAEWERNPGFDDGVDDLEHLPFVTIDNEDSRDLDQALFVEREGDGFRVWYAIADASYYVRPGSSLHARAMERGTTYYVPRHVVRMLPAALSEGIVSLNPNVPRRALLFVTRLDSAGHVVDTEVRRARIRSRAKLSYAGVDRALKGTPGLPAHEQIAGTEYEASLRTFQTVGELRVAEARERDVVEYQRREARVAIDPNDPDRFVVTTRARLDTERWNEQISLLCNIEGARLLDALGRLDPELQSVFRVHLPPVARRLESMARMVDAIVDAHGLPDTWRWEGRGNESLANYLERLPRDPQTDRIRAAIDRQVRLTNRASEFSADPGPHHALGVDAYARFSSPMREIVGVFSHKELLEGLKLTEPAPWADDEALRAQVIERANTSRALQKRLDKELALLAIQQLLTADLDAPLDARPQRRGTIVGIERGRVYVALDAFALDLKLYAEDLSSRHGCTYTAGTAELTPDAPGAPRLRVGDAVDTRTLAWDDDRRRFLLEAVPSD